MEKKFLVCNICNEKLPLNKHWRRDVQFHYNTLHKTDKKYISANEIKEKFFIRDQVNE